MLPDADLSDPDIEDCLDDEINLDPMALHESDYSNNSNTKLMLLYLIRVCYCKISRYCPTI